MFVQEQRKTADKEEGFKIWYEIKKVLLELWNQQVWNVERNKTTFKIKFMSWDQAESEHNGKDDIDKTNSVSIHVVEEEWE